MPKYVCPINWVRERGGRDVWEHEPAKSVIHCRVCHRTFPWKKKSPLYKHDQSLSHQKAKKLLIQNKTQRDIDASNPPPFASDLAKMLAVCNIPINKVENKVFVKFVEKYTGHLIPSRKTVMKNIELQSKVILSKINEKIKGDDFYILWDKAKDVRGKPMAIVFIGLFRTFLERPLLVNIFEIQSQECDAIVNGVLRTIEDIYGSEVNPECFKLFITDDNLYGAQAAQILRGRFPGLGHGTCGTSSISVIAKSVGVEPSSVNRLFSETKRSLKCDLKLPKFSANVSHAHIKDLLLLQWNADLLDF